MSDVVEHYRSDGITERVVSALVDAGIPRNDIGVDVLATVDEFHLGGRAASRRLIDVLRTSAPTSLLDVGSGIGGFARLAATELGCAVTGIDLTPAFVEAATDLTSIVGLADRIRFDVGSATDIGLPDDSVDALTMLHVGMNIADKESMASAFAGVVRPGGVAVIYDVMRVADGEIAFPVPWASTAATSFVDSPSRYREALTSAGFVEVESFDLTDLVFDVLTRAADAPRPPVHLGHLMGSSFPAMIANLSAALRAGIVAPTMVVARR